MSRHSEDGLHLDEHIMLLAAFALGAWLAVCPAQRMNLNRFPGDPFWNRLDRSRFWVALICPFIAPATVVLPLLALRRNRWSPREALRGPGATGCVAASAGLMIQGVEMAPRIVRGVQYMIGPIHTWLIVAKPAGFTVLGAWIAFRLIGAGGGSTSCLDRVGVVLAAIWCLGAVGWALIDLYLTFAV